jgi:hypothetical protein
MVDPDPALKAVALWTNRARGVTEESTRESLKYSTIDIANIGRLIVEFETALVSTYETLEVAGSAFAIMAGKAKVRVAVCGPMRLDGIDGPAQLFDCTGGGFALLLSFVGIELRIVERPFELINRLTPFRLGQGRYRIFWSHNGQLGGEYADRSCAAPEIAALAPRVAERGFYSISWFGSDGRLELASRFCAVTETVGQLAKAEPPFGCRIERNSPFQLPSRLTRPAQGLLIPCNLVMVFGFDGRRWPRPRTHRCEHVERPLRLFSQTITPGKSERQSQFFDIAKRCTGFSGAAG